MQKHLRRRSNPWLILPLALSLALLSWGVAAIPQESEPAPAGEAASAQPAQQPFRNLRQFPAVTIDPNPEKWVGDPIDLSLRDADLVEVLRSFAKMTDVNIIIDPKVKGKVTLELRQVPWDQALAVILKTQGLGMEIDGNIWSMQPIENMLPR